MPNPRVPETNDTIAVNARQQRFTNLSGRFGKMQEAHLTHLTLRGTPSAIIVLLRIAMHADPNGVCTASKQTVLKESLLPLSTAYQGFSTLLDLGVITRSADQRTIYIEQITETGELPCYDQSEYSDQPEYGDSDQSELNSDQSTTPRYKNRPFNRQTDDGGEMTAKVTNVQRSGAGVISPSQPKTSPTNITAAKSYRPVVQKNESANGSPVVDQIDLARACLTKIRELSGIEITDSHKFAKAEPQRTQAEWFTLIDEAWALRDTALRHPNYVEFNAGKVINYAQYRAKYRKGTRDLQTSVTDAQRSSYIESALRMVRDAKTDTARLRRLTNLVVFGVSRNELLGRITESDLSALFPSGAD